MRLLFGALFPRRQGEYTNAEDNYKLALEVESEAPTYLNNLAGLYRVKVSAKRKNQMNRREIPLLYLHPAELLSFCVAETTRQSREVVPTKPGEPAQPSHSLVRVAWSKGDHVPQPGIIACRQSECRKQNRRWIAIVRDSYKPIETKSVVVLRPQCRRGSEHSFCPRFALLSTG